MRPRENLKPILEGNHTKINPSTDSARYPHKKKIETKHSQIFYFGNKAHTLLVDPTPTNYRGSTHHRRTYQIWAAERSPPQSSAAPAVGGAYPPPPAAAVQQIAQNEETKNRHIIRQINCRYICVIWSKISVIYGWPVGALLLVQKRHILVELTCRCLALHLFKTCLESFR